MPRNYDIFGNAINQTRILAAPSVLDPNHPANLGRPRHNESGSYTYRQRSLKLNFTLGWELEANHVPTRIPAGVQRIGDGSVDGDGAEFLVLPAVTKSPRYVLGLLKDLVHAPKLNTNKSCGFHVHVSASNLFSLARMRQWAIATEHLALQIEDLAFKAVPDTRQGNSYCKRIVPLDNGASFRANKYDNSRRYHWLNIVEMFRPNGIRTIEVRLLGNTHRWKYLLAWTLFSMELARRGWDISNKPFDVAGHVDALGMLLKNIAKDIKPLEKKLEPIPQWVYDGFKTFGIEPNAWERPLGKLSEVETAVQGLPKRFYSDNQATIENCEDDENLCGCGCGEEGACNDYMHDTGDCDTTYCGRCHDNGDCAGLPSCDSCIDRAHEDGENCQRVRCSTCRPAPRVRPPVIPVSGVTPSVFTIESRWAYDAALYGSNVASICYDEAANLPIIAPSLEDERCAEAMLDQHENALSVDREYTPSRPFTVAQIERLNRQNGERLRGNQ